MARPCAVILLILIKMMLGSCEEASAETSKEALGNEYEHMFHSIPTLFEYILEILEEKPEILEKNDVSLFQDDSQETCNGDVKREIEKCDNYLNVDEHSTRTSKRNIVLNYFAKTKYAIGTVSTSETITKIPEIVTGNDHELAGGPNELPAGLLEHKRDEKYGTVFPDSDNTLPTEIPVTDVLGEITSNIPITVTRPDLPEITNVIEPIIPRNSRIDRSVIGSKYVSNLIATEIPEQEENNIIGRVKPRDGPNGLKHVIETLNGFDNVIPKTKANLIDKSKKNKNDEKLKRNVNIDSFVGSIDWSKFYLSPEEVEEQALKTEQAIEDHNKKKEN